VITSYSSCSAAINVATDEEFEQKKLELAEIVSSMNREQAVKLQKMKALAEAMKNIKMGSGSGKSTPASAQVKAALAAAKATTEKFGAVSPEAKLAWETLEEIASSDNSEAMAGALSEEECSIEETAMEACMALEELNRVLGVQDSWTEINN
jgi:hypothetical protein